MDTMMLILPLSLIMISIGIVIGIYHKTVMRMIKKGIEMIKKEKKKQWSHY